MNRDINLLAEARLLGNIIKQPEVWFEVAPDFQAELFSDPAYRAIAEIIIDLTTGGQRPSSVKIYNEMVKRNVGLTVDDLLEVVSAHVTVSETKSLLAELEDLWKRRTVYQTLLSALNELKNEDKPTDELIAYAQQKMIEAFNQTGRSELKSMQDVCEALFLRQEAIQRGELLPVYPLNLTGLQSLLGGYETGSLNIIAARPSMGKTAFLLSECLGWAQRGLPGIIFSLEQEDVQIGQRNIANLEGIPVSYLRARLDEKQLDRFYSGLSRLRELPIEISDKRGLRPTRFADCQSRENANPDLKWVAVDYATTIALTPGTPLWLWGRTCRGTWQRKSACLYSPVATCRVKQGTTKTDRPTCGKRQP